MLAEQISWQEFKRGVTFIQILIVVQSLKMQSTNWYSLKIVFRIIRSPADNLIILVMYHKHLSIYW